MPYRAWKGPFGDLKALNGYRDGRAVTVSHLTTPTPGTEIVYYTEDTTTNFNNPERGWIVPRTGTWDFANLRSQGYTVVWASTYEGSPFRLDAFRYSAISTTRLNQIRDYFQAARNNGLKIKVRFTYNGNPMPEYPEDASEAIILQHITQLTPIFEEYEDVIAMLDHGFIGKWGEQHSSTNGLSSDTPESRQARSNILNALLDALPVSRMIGNRYPPYIREAFPEGEVYTGFTYNSQPYPTDYAFDESIRFNGSDRSRVGWLNDCFLSGESNTGTYSTWDAPQPQRFILDRATFSAVGPYTVASAETCGTSLNEYNESLASIAEMELMGGPDLLNREYSETHYNRWISEGYYDEITRRLGYRISLLEATLPNTVTPGQSYSITLKLKNSGFGKLYNPRPLVLVFDGPSTVEVTLSSDCRTKMPLGGQTVDSSFSFVAPAGLLDGETYSLHLKLPDTSTSTVSGSVSRPIENDVRYMVRMGNIGTWDAATGRNSLNHSIIVGQEVISPPVTNLLGVGSASTSLVNYPKTGSVTSGDWYVDPSSPTNGVGTLEDPFNTLESALSAVSSGETVLVRSGTLYPTTVFYRTSNWAETVRIFNYGNERPVIDCVNNVNVGNTGRAVAFDSSSGNEHWKGFEIKNATNIAFDILGANVTIEDMWVHDCGKDLSTTEGRGMIRAYRSGVNVGILIQDCAVWNCGDGITTGTNAPDCYQVAASTTSSGVKFVRCFGAHGADDVFDLWGGTNTLILDCVAYKGGYYSNGLSAGDGGGFKMGGSRSGIGNNSLVGSIAVACKSEAIKPNSSPLASTFTRNTCVDSVGYGWNLNNATTDGNRHIATDNIDYNNGLGPGLNSTRVDDTFNSWNLGISNPSFSDPSSFDWSLITGSSAIGVSSTSGNLGASTIALSIAKEWIGVVEGEPLPTPTPESELLGVARESTSLTNYPKIQNSTTGNWFVDSSVSSSGNGQSLSTAFKTLQEGLSALQSGQTLLVKGGVYTFTGTINRSTQWATTTRVMGYGEDRPILDFSGLNIRGLYFNNASNELWHRFEVRNTNMNRGEVHTGNDGVFANYSNNLTFSDIWIHDIGGDGLRLYVTNDSEVLDCVVWRQGDPSLGSSWPSVPDGFQSSGVGNGGPHSLRNVFARCVALNCPDDGFDCFSSQDTLFVDCASLYPGTYYDGVTAGRGRNGFKLGGATGSTRNTALGCFTLSGGRGADYNGGGESSIINMTVYQNDWVGIKSGNNGVVKNSISVGHGTNYDEVDGTVTDTYNTWNLGISTVNFPSPGTPDWDYSLGAGSQAIGVGDGGVNLGASYASLELAKEWLSKDLNQDSSILGVGSSSSSLIDYPKTGTVYTGDLWVDPKLPTNGTGTEASPFNSLSSALSAVQDGQRIIVRSGTIAPNLRFNRSTNWTTGIEIFAYGNERPVLDCVNLGTGSAGRILNLYGRREHWKGFEVINGKPTEPAILLSGPATEYTIEDFRIHDCIGDAIMIGNFSGENAGGNLIMDTWAYRLGDGVSVGTNTGDAYTVTASVGSVTRDNVFVRCLGANGPDDNYDLFRGRGTRLIDCVSIGAGYYWNGTPGSESMGDGAGFKMGGSDSDAGNNYAIGCISIDSRSNGFAHNEALNTTQSNPNIFFQRCTSYGSGLNGYDLGGDGANHLNRAEDCISFNDVSPRYIGANATESNNTWNLSITNPDFSDAATYDFSLAPTSSAIAAGISGGNLGASEVALNIAKEWFDTMT